VLYLLDGLGIATGVEIGRLAAAGRFISEALGREPASKAARALAAARKS
jgi:hydroxymethylglutaryl-CoA lyase